MAISSYVSEEIPIPVYEGKDFSRADLMFYGIGQIGPSFEARVFLNNPEADETTPLEGAQAMLVPSISSATRDASGIPDTVTSRKSLGTHST